MADPQNIDTGKTPQQDQTIKPTPRPLDQNQPTPDTMHDNQQDINKDKRTA